MSIAVSLYIILFLRQKKGAKMIGVWKSVIVGILLIIFVIILAWLKFDDAYENYRDFYMNEKSMVFDRQFRIHQSIDYLVGNKRTDIQEVTYSINEFLEDEIEQLGREELTSSWWKYISVIIMSGISIFLVVLRVMYKREIKRW